MDLRIQGKTALITGGSHGIGRATALAFAGEGCNVVICARNKERVDATVEEIRSCGAEALGISVDVTGASAVGEVVSAARERFGSIDILVNNVGGGGRWGKRDVIETAPEVWEEVFEKNALTAARFTTACLPDMKRNKWGRVVAVSSIYGKEGGGRPWFNMSKAAQISMMKCLAMNKELSRYNITFNSVAPGPIMIEGTGWAKERDDNPSAFQAQMEATTVLGRLGTSEEVAAVVVFLCSAQASFVNGASVAIDGGDGRAF